MKRALLYIILSIVPISFYAQDNLVILFTSDIHSTAREKDIRYSTPYYQNDSLLGYIVGGYSRLATIIKREKELAKQNGDAIIVVDAGDISMGSPFQTLFTVNAFDIVSFGMMGYDAISFGNHDFDFGIDSTAKMLSKALSYKQTLNLPYILSANLAPISGFATKHFNEYGVIKSTIIERNGKKIGIIGAMGENAYSVISVKEGIAYTPSKEIIQKEIDSLKNKGAHYTVLLSHGGTMGNGNIDKSEDATLAKQLKGLDIIISGHDHDILHSPAIINNSIIGVPGAYNEYIGKMVINKNQLISYNLIPILDTISPNLEIDRWVNQNLIKTDSIFNSLYGLKLSDSIINLSVDMERKRDENGNMLLGYEIAKSYSIIAQSKSGIKDIIGIVPDGVIRSNLSKGIVTTTDVFNVLSLGNNREGAPGYPLVLSWLNGKEIGDLCELVASISGSLPDSRLYFYGVNFTYNPLKIPFTKVSKVEIFGKKMEKDKLYPIVTGLYTARLIGLLKSESFGLLSAEPKDKNNNLIENVEDQIISENLPEWYAFASYLKNDYTPEPEIKSGAYMHRSYLILIIYLVSISFISFLCFIVVRTLLKLFRKR